MDLPLLLNIKKINGLPVDFKVSKGEIVYLKHGTKSQSLFDLILKMNSKNSEGQIFEFDFNKVLSSDDQSAVRKQIGYVDPNLFLRQEETIEANARYYIEAIDIATQPAFTRFESYRKDLNVSRGAKIKDLNPIELYCFKIAVVLAKNPRILLVENPFSQLNPNSYQDQMEQIYNLIRNKGITYIAAISDKQIMQTYPGRYIEL